MKKILLFCLFSCTLVSCMENKNTTEIPQNTGNTISQHIEEKTYIDVRTLDEYNEWHIKNAIHIPLSDIQNGINLDKIPKDTPVHIYCRSGNRSGQAIKILSEKHGYTNLINAGGITDIKDAEIIK